MILRAMVDKVRKMFEQTPVVDLQPVTSPVIVKDLDEQRKYWIDDWVKKDGWVEHPGLSITQPKKNKPYNVKLAHRKSKSQKRNWKHFKKKGRK